MGKDNDIFATSLAVKKISFCMMLFNITNRFVLLRIICIFVHLLKIRKEVKEERDKF